MMIKTEEKDFNRDMTSKALINNNVRALEDYKQRKQQSLEIVELNNKVADLSTELSSIKELLLELLRK